MCGMMLGMHARARPFRQVDVFSTDPYRGNPVAVVHDADELADATMARVAAWTNLSETTFILSPTSVDADYRVRIFTPVTELPFAGHPTLGTCHAWLEAGGVPRDPEVIVQECAAGLIPVRRTPRGLAFDAPPLVREGPVDGGTLAQVADLLRISRDAIVDAEWIDNGPGWLGVLLEDAAAVLAVRPGPPGPVDLFVGIAGLHPPDSPTAVEVRGFFPKGGVLVEDPVTGSLNASLAGWLIRTGRLAAPYVASQGTALGREGRVHVTQAPDGTVSVGGGTVTCIRGEIDL
jgi:PhzF family phenazine biosynthesis protein